MMQFIRALAYIFSCSIFGVAAGVAPADFRQQESDKVWEEKIRAPYFKDREIIEDGGILTIKAPYASEDATLTPISIHMKIPQKADQYIREISIFIDKNPVALLGVFEFTTLSGRADLALRARVDDFSYVRAVAETNDGRLYMAKSFVRAKGACSAPPPPSAKDSKRLLGKMKIKTIGDVVFGQPNLIQLRVRHPNITGLAPIEIGSRVRPPAFFLRSLTVDFSDQLVMKASLTFSVSMDPSFRFFFTPDKEGVLTIRGEDSKNNRFESFYQVEADGVLPKT